MKYRSKSFKYRIKIRKKDGLKNTVKVQVKESVEWRNENLSLKASG